MPKNQYYIDVKVNKVIDTTERRVNEIEQECQRCLIATSSLVVLFAILLQSLEIPGTTDS